jgi:outer membrane protein OmpA-like peptidoglycan-associated protein
MTWVSSVRACVLAGLAAGLLATAPARAEQQHINTQRWQWTMDKHGIARTHAGRLLGHLEFDLGLWGDYERNPMIIRGSQPVLDALGNLPEGQNKDAPLRRRQAGLVNQRVASELSFSIGLFNWVQLFGSIPVAFFQDRGQDISQTGVRITQLNQFNLGDARLGGKIRILRADRQFVDLAFVPQLTLPMGMGFQALSFNRVGPANLIPVPYANPSFGGPWRGYMTDGFPTLQPELALSREFWGLFAGVNGGLRLRRPYEVANVLVTQELLLRGAVGFRGRSLARKVAWMKYLPVELGLEGAAYQPLPHPYVTLPYIHPNTPKDRPTLRTPSPLRAGSPGAELTAIAGVDVFWLHPFVGASVGVLPGVGTPDWRVMGGVRLSTEFAELFRKKPPPKSAPAASPAPAVGPTDQDGDGVVDSADRCPETPGVPENQGCPVVNGPKDADGDGLTDDVDACPRAPEDKDGVLDADGCPEDDADKDGVLDDGDACPLEPETRNSWRDEDGCPDDDADARRAAAAMDKANSDTDGDGLKDGQDPCPADAEDVDGFEDLDGCPEVDNDGDGFADANDKCPTEPEIVNGNKDDDGCPDKGRSLVVLTKEKIEIRDKIYFATGKADIQKRSFELLDQVISILKAHPEIRLAIEGHTDDQGDDTSNLKLSQARAESVQAYFVRAGVDMKRLKANGYGETRPVADNASAKGREQNRRVEFLIPNDAAEAPKQDDKAP